MGGNDNFKIRNCVFGGCCMQRINILNIPMRFNVNTCIYEMVLTFFDFEQKNNDVLHIHI